ncbi:hypothetical protein FA10DRAFT_268586 [Acaromyces ingoldii]|uniref:Heme haloperoxidase family profile domain-containing protein n=1 Tax=Acaromyces ingoldii TaxID=215250 RepID=A0A316YGX1_9BASI|nr:hypothetical protein FA10DRAFT_268586 [Acaromyces ingoldii]PWN88391.1 hypothetical protein FA10DRAFT_268586 [Acaromyces ingoldii]
MKFLATFTAAAAAIASVAGQAAETPCDKYTTALLKTNNATNQLTVLTLVVNTALIGNYPNPAGAPKNNVTGILNPGQVNGTGPMVNLLPYFDGTLKSTNVNGNAQSVNFLDGGGAAPLMSNMAAYANMTSSKQYMLITHLYEFFGVLLGCSAQNSSSPFKNYEGRTSMSEVHRFMNLNETEMNYFIQEVGASATSFGVTTEDATAIGGALNSMFNKRCLAPASIGGGANASQSICLATSCPVADPSSCAQTGQSYGNGTNGVEPASASTSTTGSGSSSGKDGASSMVVNVLGALSLGAAGLVAFSM